MTDHENNISNKNNTQTNLDINSVYTLFESLSRLKGTFDRVRENLAQKAPRKPRTPGFPPPMNRGVKPRKLDFKPKPLKLNFKLPKLNFKLPKFQLKPNSSKSEFKPKPFNLDFKPLKDFFAAFPLKLDFLSKPFKFGKPLGFPKQNYSNRVYIKRTFLSNRLIIVKPPQMKATEEKVEKETEKAVVKATNENNVDSETNKQENIES